MRRERAVSLPMGEARPRLGQRRARPREGVVVLVEEEREGVERKGEQAAQDGGELQTVE